jgi:hypothetical protein
MLGVAEPRALDVDLVVIDSFVAVRLVVGISIVTVV